MCQICALHPHKSAHVMVDDNSKDEGLVRKLLSKVFEIKQLLCPQSPKGRNMYLLLSFY